MVSKEAKRADKNNEKIKNLKDTIKSAERELENANADAFSIKDAVTSKSTQKDIEKRQKKAQKTIDDCNKQLEKLGEKPIEVILTDPETVLKKRAEKVEAAAKKKEEAAKSKEAEKKEKKTIKETVSDASHNLNASVKGQLAKAGYKKHGTNGLTDDPSDENAKFVGIVVNTMDGLRDPKVVAEYVKKFNNRELSPEPLFDKKDRLYELLMKFYKDPLNSKSQIDAELVLIGKFNELNREVSESYGNGNKDRNGFVENLFAKSAKKSYETGKELKKLNTLWNRHQYVLKEIAWLCAHSYVLNKFMQEYKIFNLIPKANAEVIPVWNSYISQMEDLPSDVKTYFSFLEDGTMPFKEETKGRYRIDPVSGLALDPNADPAMKESPQDDVPFDDSKVVGKPVDLDKAKTEAAVAEAAKKLNEEMRAAMDNDKDPAPVKEEPKTETMFGEVEASEKRITFGSLNKKEEAPQTTINPANVANSMNINRQSDVRVITDPNTGMPKVVEYSQYDANNKIWESAIPRLDKFTKTCKKIGYSVLYDNAPGYPGLVQASIINSKFGNVHKTVMIDPCLIYGDTLRIVTMENPQGDIRKETFIPISQENIIVKYIKNGLDKDDRKKLSEALPRAITDFREKYTLLDKVDLRNCTIDGKPMGFQDWRQMVINISNVLRVEGYPICRVRVADIKGPNKFTLICDENVLAAFNTAIFNEESHLQNVMSGLKIEYDAEAYKDNNNIKVSYNDDKAA